MTLIIALILAYVICWTPWHLFHILTAFNVRIQFETCNSFFHVYNWWVQVCRGEGSTTGSAWSGSILHWTRSSTPSWATASNSNCTRRWTKWNAFCPVHVPSSKRPRGAGRIWCGAKHSATGRKHRIEGKRQQAQAAAAVGWAAHRRWMWTR